jgi:mannose-6-phosphate isomerase-like protein (cupin superfamily)
MNNVAAEIPPDDLTRPLRYAQPEKDGSLTHIGLVGATYTITVSGADTNGRFSVIDMYVPPGGGPPPHRHDFEETFIILEGEIQATFRGQKLSLRVSPAPVRMICICSPAGPENFFIEVGVPVATRTTPPPQLNEAEQKAFIQKVLALSSKYRTELVRGA